MKKILPLFKTTLSLISIYILGIFQNKNKRSIMFYFPVKIYQDNLFDLIKKLKKNNNIILVYNLYSKDEIKDKKNSFFIDFNLLKFIPLSNFFLKDIKIFLTSYVVYVFPPRSINTYISHDIYDAPMVNKSLERKIFLRINKLDYIFVSSKISLDYFKSQFKKFKINAKPKLINAGYIKLDHIKKRIKNSEKNNKKKYILIAPGYSYAFRQYNMYQYLEKIIEKILIQSYEKIIYRPHPLDLTPKGDVKIVKKIINKFKNNKNFSYDFSTSYLKSFKNSKFLITDLSSTAYTYSFATERPVIFFSKNEQKLKKDYFSKLNYFKDRNKIGVVTRNINDLIKIFKNKTLYNSKIQKNIINLRKNRIEFFESAVKRTASEINKIRK